MSHSGGCLLNRCEVLSSNRSTIKRKKERGKEGKGKRRKKNKKPNSPTVIVDISISSTIYVNFTHVS
jgi:hypothetical protein